MIAYFHNSAILKIANHIKMKRTVCRTFINTQLAKKFSSCTSYKTSYNSADCRRDIQVSGKKQKNRTVLKELATFH
jgi:hypothetical protein